MKNFFKIALAAVAVTSVVASAGTPQFPFPQNKRARMVQLRCMQIRP